MSVASLLGLGSREIVALVGGGGKSTLLFALGRDLAAAGRGVVLTTTTKMGRDQIVGEMTVCDSIESIGSVTRWPAMLVCGGDDHKITGPEPGDVGRLLDVPGVDLVVVEADGAHGRPIKAPASHEPVVPPSSTMVVIAMGIDAVGGRLGEVTHRPERAAAFTGRDVDHALTVADCVTILMHPEGALRVVPPAARVAVAITKVGNQTQAVAESIRSEIESYPVIDRVVIISDTGP